MRFCRILVRFDDFHTQMQASLQVTDMETYLVSSNSAKICALAVFAFLVLWVCAFLVAMNRKGDGP